MVVGARNDRLHRTARCAGRRRTAASGSGNFSSDRVVSMNHSADIRVLTPIDIAPMRDMLSLFGRAFADPATYADRQPDDSYLRHALYTKLGTREDVLHFDIAPKHGGH